MSLPIPPQPKKDLSLLDLNADPQLAFKNDALKKVLSKKPNPKWLKNHPQATKKIVDAHGTKKEVPAEYLPIDKVEFLLDYIFQEWKIEVLSSGIMFHSIYVTVRVHYKNPITQEWLFHDGVGAVKAQSDAKTAFGPDTIKANAIQIGLPAAKSFAIKDAVEHLGDLFGRNINRADTISFEGAYNEPKPEAPKDKSVERLTELMNSCKTKADLKKFEKDLTTTEHRILYDQLWKKLL